MERTGMTYKFCPCGRPIGVQNAEDTAKFYDNCDWEKPVTICPGCNEPLVADKLKFSEMQLDAIADCVGHLIQLAREARQKKQGEEGARLG